MNNSQSIEAKIEREVCKMIQVSESKLKMRIDELHFQNSLLITKLQKAANEESTRKAEETQLYI